MRAALAVWLTDPMNERAGAFLQELQKSRAFTTLLWQIGELGPKGKGLLPIVLQGLDDPDYVVRKTASEALQNIDPKAASNLGGVSSSPKPPPY